MGRVLFEVRRCREGAARISHLSRCVFYPAARALHTTSHQVTPTLIKDTLHPRIRRHHTKDKTQESRASVATGRGWAGGRARGRGSTPQLAKVARRPTHRAEMHRPVQVPSRINSPPRRIAPAPMYGQRRHRAACARSHLSIEIAAGCRQSFAPTRTLSRPRRNRPRDHASRAR